MVIKIHDHKMTGVSFEERLSSLRMRRWMKIGEIGEQGMGERSMASIKSQ
jgi:hypothetical protein